MPRKKVAIEDLTGMIKRGFDGVDKRFDETAQKADIIRLEKRIENLENGQEEIKIKLDNVPYRFELKELEKRVATVERKIALRNR